MRYRLLVLFGVLAMIVGGSVAPVIVQGQRAQETPQGQSTPDPENQVRLAPPFRKEALNWKPTATAWGDPDLQGEWSGMTTTPFQRPKEGTEVVTDPAELARRREHQTLEEPGLINGYNVAWREYGRPVDYHPAFKGRVSLIVDPADGKLPPLVPAAQQRAAARAANRQDPDSPANPEDLGAAQRCIVYDLAIGGSVSSWYRIVQSPGWVMINQYRMHDVRLIPLDGRPHRPKSVREWQGDARGHWEGQTLVVETTNFNGKAPLRGSDDNDENMRLIERYTRIDADTIKYEYTVDDPTVWTKPWTVSMPLAKDTDGFFEYACHEGNYGMIGTLSGTRAQEQKAAAK
jgi:hypothetical protein